MGLGAIKQFSHSLENTLDDVRQRKTKLSEDLQRAVVHGFDLPEERLARGVNETGNVWLKAELTRTHVVVMVQDDGRGIDVVRTKLEEHDGRITVNSISETIQGVDNIAGVAQLGARRLALVLSVPDLVQRFGLVGHVEAATM